MKILSSRLHKTYEQCLTCRCVSGLHSSGEPGKVVLNYAEGDSATLSGHGMALRRVQWMDVALVCAPRSALSGLMTTLCNPTHTYTHTGGKEERLKGTQGKGNHGFYLLPY